MGKIMKKEEITVKKNRALELFKDGLHSGQIAERLSVSKSLIYRWRNDFINNGEVFNQNEGRNYVF